LKERALIELHYLPSVQYFSKLLAYRQITIEQCENYQKGSYRNRCHLAGANGLQILSIPLEKGKHQKLPIREVRITYAQPWHLQHWRSIQAAYANAPFFPYYSEAIQALYEERPEHLFAFNRQLFELICQQLGLSEKITYSTDYQSEVDTDTDDLRELITPKDPLSSKDPAFEATPYPQVFTERHGFLSNLSILDLLFCTGPQAVSILRNSISNQVDLKKQP
jgi:hypothetical protein